MTTLQVALIAKLITLNTAAGARVHHEQIPQGAPFPFIASTELGSTRTVTLDRRALFTRSQVQLGIFAMSALTIELIIKQIEDEFFDFSGWLDAAGEIIVSTVRVERSADEVSFVDGGLTIKGKTLNLFFAYY